MAVFIVLWGVCVAIATAIGSSKGKAGTGFALGLLLGLIGVIIVAVMGDDKLGRVQAKPAAEGWFHDPLGRFDARYYDGRKWTQHVGRVGPDGARQQFEDPV